jgi:hypothetical protein
MASSSSLPTAQLSRALSIQFLLIPSSSTPRSAFGAIPDANQGLPKRHPKEFGVLGGELAQMMVISGSLLLGTVWT